MADEEHDVYGGEIPEDAEGEYDLDGNPEDASGDQGDRKAGEGGSGADVDAAAKVCALIPV